jgi:hypothetical protein
VGRIACAAVEDGVSEEDIVSALEECIDFKNKKECEEVEEKLKNRELENALLISAIVLVIPLVRLVVKVARLLRRFIDKKTIDKIEKEYNDLIVRLREIRKELPVEVLL